jgi:hypothetical protein
MGRYILAGDGTFIIERRAAPRYDVELSVRVGLYGAGNKSIRGITTNISEWGVQLLIPSPLPSGAVLNFECSDFAGTGEVVWSRDEGDQVRLGMKLVSMSNTDRQTLRELLSSLTREQMAEVASR